MRHTLLICCSATALLALAGHQAPASRSRLSQSRCAPVDSESYYMKDYINFMMHDNSTGGAGLRGNLHLVPVDAASIQQISVDSLCRVAADLITSYDSLPPGISRTVYLMKVGSIRMAMDLNYHAGEWIPIFATDSTLTKVYDSVLH